MEPHPAMVREKDRRVRPTAFDAETHRRAFRPTLRVILAKAGIQAAPAFSRGGSLYSRFRGNDWMETGSTAAETAWR